MTYMAFGCRLVNVFDDAACITRSRTLSRRWLSCAPRTPAALPTQPAGQWWDSDAWPEAAGFAGFLINRVDGLWGPSPYKREQVSLGTRSRAKSLTLKQAQHTGRTVTIEGTAYGRNCCSTAYGINALAQMLRSGCTCRTTDLGCTCRQGSGTCSCSNSACSGDTLRVFDDRPHTVAPDGVIIDNADRWYILKGVGVVEGPELIQTDATCGCGCVAEQKFRVVLVASDPHLYQDQVTVVNTQTFANEAATCFPNPVFWCGANQTVAAPSYASLLPPAPLPPQPSGYVCLAPFISTNSLTFDVGSTIFDTFLNLRVTAGSGPLTGVTFSWWRSDGTHAPESDFYTLDTACGALTISEIEAGATLTVDSTCGTASVTLADTTVLPGDDRIFTTGGRPWDGSAEVSCGVHVLRVAWDTQADVTGASYSAFVQQGLP